MRPNLPSVLTPMTKEKSSGCGCLGGGCAMAAIVVLILGGALFWGAWTTWSGIKSMTSAEAKPVPTFNASDVDAASALEKVRLFNATFDAGQEAEISLSASEINTLIARYEPWSALRGHVFVSIQEERISAQVSLPLSQIRLMQDRQFNGDVSMTFITEDGKPKPSSVSVRTGDTEFPRWAMRYITSKSFVESLGIPSISEGDSIGSNLTGLEIKDEKLIVRAKKQ